MQVLEDHGSALACALNAACTALVDAGIAMHHLFGELLQLVSYHAAAVCGK